MTEQVAPKEDEAQSDFYMTLGQSLRAARRTAGLTLCEVEELTAGEFKTASLGSYERGDRQVSVQRLLRLADLYRTTVNDLVTGLTPERP